MWKTAPLDEFAFALDNVDSLDLSARFGVVFMKIVFWRVFFSACVSLSYKSTIHLDSRFMKTQSWVLNINEQLTWH